MLPLRHPQFGAALAWPGGRRLRRCHSRSRPTTAASTKVEPSRSGLSLRQFDVVRDAIWDLNTRRCWLTVLLIPVDWIPLAPGDIYFLLEMRSRDGRAIVSKCLGLGACRVAQGCTFVWELPDLVLPRYALPFALHSSPPLESFS